MAKVYYRWTPIRRGLTGAEYLAQWVMERYPNVSVIDVISDKESKYSIVEGSGDDFRKCVRDIECKFSAQKMTLDELAGAIVVNYTPPSAIEGETSTQTWYDYAASFGLTVEPAKELDYAKAYKIMLLKEQARLLFPDWNDSLADVAKALFAKLVWYGELTEDEQLAVDTAIDQIKTLYTKDACIKSCNTLAENLQKLSGYYIAKQAVINASTIEEVLAVDF